jgi:hypothetical protein
MSIYSKDFITLEDGYQYYWVDGKGAISQAELRKIAAELDELNKPYDTEVNNYFNNPENVEI